MKITVLLLGCDFPLFHAPDNPQAFAGAGLDRKRSRQVSWVSGIKRRQRMQLLVLSRKYDALTERGAGVVPGA